MIKLAVDVDHELRTNIIQAEKREDNVYGKLKLYKYNIIYLFTNGPSFRIAYNTRNDASRQCGFQSRRNN